MAGVTRFVGGAAEYAGGASEVGMFWACGYEVAAGTNELCLDVLFVLAEFAEFAVEDLDILDFKELPVFFLVIFALMLLKSPFEDILEVSL